MQGKTGASVSHNWKLGRALNSLLHKWKSKKSLHRGGASWIGGGFNTSYYLDVKRIWSTVRAIAVIDILPKSSDFWIEFTGAIERSYKKNDYDFKLPLNFFDTQKKGRWISRIASILKGSIFIRMSCADKRHTKLQANLFWTRYVANIKR